MIIFIIIIIISSSSSSTSITIDCLFNYLIILRVVSLVPVLLIY